MALGDTIRAVEQQRAGIVASTAAIGNLRSGLVREIHTKCGCPACHCMREYNPGHGPCFQLVFDAGGKRTTRSVSAERAAVLRAEVSECQRLRRLTGELIGASEQLSEARFACQGPSEQPRATKPVRRPSPPPSRTSPPAS